MCLVQFIFGSQYEVSWFLEGYVDANTTGMRIDRWMTGFDWTGLDLTGLNKRKEKLD
jgi:hypothetical protein